MNYKTNFTMSMRRGWLAGMRTMMAPGTRAMMALGTRAAVVLLLMLLTSTSAWAQETVATVTEGENTTTFIQGDGDGEYATAAAAFKAAVAAANDASTAVTIKLLNDITIGQPDQPSQNCNILIGSSQDSNVRNITLDLNGQTLTGSSKNCVIQVNGEKTSVTITDSSSGQNGTICNGSTYIGSGVILNYGTLTFEAGTISNEQGDGITNGDSENNKGELSVTGGKITTEGTAIHNDDHSTATISKCTIIGEYPEKDNFNNFGILNSGKMTIGSEVSINKCFAGIRLSASLTLNALPTFGTGDNANKTDISLEPTGKIAFGETFQAPATPLDTINVMINEGSPGLYAFTTGYAAAFPDGTTGKTVDPAKVFKVDGFKVVLSDGEALAYNDNLVAANTDTASGSIICLYNIYHEESTEEYYQNFATVAAAFRAAVTAANEATSDVTLTLYNKDVDLGDNTIELNNEHLIGEGTDEERPVAVTLDLNGQKITSTRTDCVVSANYKVTITDSAEDGAITNTNDYNYSYALSIGSAGDVTISGGSISGASGINNTSGGTLMVTGGTISGTSGNGIYNIGVVNGGEVTASTLTVTGGSISGTGYGIFNSRGSLTLTGGTIISTGNSAIYNHESSTLTIGSGVTVRYPSNAGCKGIDFSKSKCTFVMTGLPTFDNDGSGYDINLAQDMVIAFADDFTYSELTHLIKVSGPGPGTIFTSGYGTHCVYPEGHAKAGQTVNPSEVFIYLTTNDGEYAELDATSGEVRFNTPFNVTVNNTSTAYCGTLKSAIDKVAYITKQAKERNAELTSCIIQPQKDYQISYADLTSGTVEFGDDENAIVATLDLNGHTISGDADDNISYLITVAENSTLNITGDGAIVDDCYWGCCIANYGTLNIAGGTFTVPVRCCSIHNFGGGSLTVSGGTFNVNEGGCAIQNWADLTLSALPTFVHPDNATDCTDIDLDQDAVITFDKAITAAPTAPIVVKVKNAAPYVFTSGYGTNVKDTSGKVIDPASVFAITADNSTIVAYESNNVTEAAVLAYETVTFPVGQSTYYGDKGLQLVVANDDLKFYTVTGVSGTTAQLAEITGKTFGKNTPLIVSNTGAEAVEATVLAAATDAMETAFAASCTSDLGTAGIFDGFKGTASAIDKIGFTDGIEYYGFTGHDFVKIRQDGPVSANRCWLEIGGMSVSATRSITLGWPDGETTGVVSMDNGKWIMDNEAGAQWFTVSGQRVSKPTRKGLYIRGGKKVVIR